MSPESPVSCLLHISSHLSWSSRCHHSYVSLDPSNHLYCSMTLHHHLPSNSHVKQSSPLGSQAMALNIIQISQLLCRWFNISTVVSEVNCMLFDMTLIEGCTCFRVLCNELTFAKQFTHSFSSYAMLARNKLDY